MAVPDPSDDVVTRASTLAAASSRPLLTPDEVKAAVRQYPRVDVDGIAADMAGWTPTWDLNRAVAELWGIKAARVAGDFTFGADGASYNKGDVLVQCLKMEAHFSAKLAGSFSTAGDPTDARWMTDRLMPNG